MNKYKARRTTIDGYTFHSAREAERYLVLKDDLRRGVITNLVLQPEFTLLEGFTDNIGNKIKPIKYRADFGYTRSGIRYVEDVKGIKTQGYILKKKLLLYHLKDSDVIFIETK